MPSNDIAVEWQIQGHKDLLVKIVMVKYNSKSYLGAPDPVRADERLKVVGSPAEGKALPG